MVNFIQEFHKSAKLPRMTYSFLTLLPKTKRKSKVISKILAARFRKVIGKLISRTQTTFIPEKQILDGAMVTN